MGEMADLETRQIENGETLVRNKITGEKLLIDNMMLMYSSCYDLDSWEIIEEEGTL